MEGITKELAQELLSIVQSSKSFVVDEVPEVIYQILTFKFYENLIYGLIWSTVMITCLFLARKLWKRAKADKVNEEWWYSGSAGCYAAAGIILPSHMGYYIDVVKITVAPKLYVLEFLLGIVGGS